jgi:hypothetical protein
LALPVLAALLVGLAGCSKVNYKKTVSIDPGDTQFFEIPARDSEQKIHIDVTAPGVPVNVIAAEATLEEAQKIVEMSKDVAKKLGGSDKPSESVSFDVTVPAKVTMTILVENPGRKDKASVTVKANSI